MSITLRATDIPRTSSRPAAHRAGRGRSADLLSLALVASILLAFFAALFPLRHYRFPVGPDAPVYLWWARLAGHFGLSAVGNRPGFPALSLVAEGTLRLPPAQTIAGLEVALAVAVGLAAYAVVGIAAVGQGTAVGGQGTAVGGQGTAVGGRGTAVAGREEPHGAGPRAPQVLAGILAGAFAALLAGGYLSNLTFVVLFLGAAALLAASSRSALAGAAALLAASLLAHPQFFALGAAILLLAAMPGLRPGSPAVRLRDRDGARIVTALLVGAAVGGIGLLAMLPGFGPLNVDTSQDAFLRRAGLGGLLRHYYRTRLAQHWTRYLLPVSVPLEAAGAWWARGFLGRFLRGWGLVVVAGVAVALVVGLAPAERVLDFAFVLPVGAALAVPRLWRMSSENGPGLRTVATAVLVLALGALLFFEGRNWWQQKSYVSPPAAQEVTEAARAAAATPAGTPLVFIVDTNNPTVSFLATRLGNLARDAVPPDRIPDVFVYVGSPANFVAGRPTLNGQTEHDALSRLYLEDIRRAGGHPVAFWLQRMNSAGGPQARAAGAQIAPGVIAIGERARPPSRVAGPLRSGDPLSLTNPWLLVLWGVVAIAFLTLVGVGWTLGLALGPDARLRSGSGLALAPAVGAAGLILAGTLLERLGVPLSGAGPFAISGAVAAGGYACAFTQQRRRPVGQGKAVAEPGPKVAQ